MEGPSILDKVEGKIWETKREGTSVVFKCKICGFTVRSHVKYHDLGFYELILHVIDTHINP